MLSGNQENIQENLREHILNCSPTENLYCRYLLRISFFFEIHTISDYSSSTVSGVVSGVKFPGGALCMLDLHKYTCHLNLSSLTLASE